MPKHIRFATVLIIAALAAIGILTLAPESARHAPAPFWCLSCGRLDLLDVVLNILLFVPLGVGLGLRPASLLRVAAIGFLASAAIELLQVGIPGRESSARDIVTNTVGAFAGAWLTVHRAVVLRPSARQARALAVGWAVVLLGIITAGGWALQPVRSSQTAWSSGQANPGADDPPRFRGTVLRASLSPSGRIDAAFALRSPSDRQTTLLLFENEDGSDAYSLTTAGTAIVFRRPLRAATMGLRDPGFRIDDVLPRDSDTLDVAVAFTRREVRIDVTDTTRHRQSAVRVTPLLGWAVLVPFDWPLGPSSAVATALWTWLLFVPLGYFAAMCVRESSWSIAGIAIGVALIGLGSAPRLLGLAPESSSTWIAGVVGLTLGAAIAARRRSSRRNEPRVPTG